MIKEDTIKKIKKIKTFKIILGILGLLFLPASIFITVYLTKQNQEIRTKAATTSDIVLIRTVIDKIRPVDSELASTLETYLNQKPEILDITRQIMSANLKLLDNPVVGSNCKIDPTSKCHSESTPPPGSGTFSCGMPNHNPSLVKNVFTKFNQESWSEDGDWIGDWEEVNDATAFAPSVLYQCAIGTNPDNASELNRRANKTIDYEIKLIDEVLDEIIHEVYDYKKIGMALGGQNSLIAARLYYPQNSTNAQKIQLYSRALAIGPALAMIYDPSLAKKSPFSPVSAIGYVAYYNFSLAEITQTPSEQRLYVLLGRYLVRNNMEVYWREDSYGGYYKSMDSHGDIPVEGPLAFEQGYPLSAWAKLFKFDPGSRFFIEQKLPSVQTLHDKLLKNQAFVETVEPIGNNVKFLSSNLLISRGLIYIYEALHDSDDGTHRAIANYAKNQAMEVLTFINNNFYVGYDSRGYLDHHIFYDTQKSGRYCTGCNFQALENLDLLWKVYHQIPPIITTPTPQPTATPTSVPTATPTPTPTPTSIPATPTPLPTPIPTATPTFTPQPTSVFSPTATPTPNPTSTPGLTQEPTQPIEVKVGDITGDGKVDEADYAVLMANFGMITTPPDRTKGDLTGDGKVDEADYAVLMANFGK